MRSDAGLWLNDDAGEVLPGDLARLWDLSPDLFAVADLEGHFLALNDTWTRLLGWSMSELLGRPYLELVHPDDVERTRTQRDGMARAGIDAVAFDNRYLGCDGRYRWLRWSAATDLEAGRIYAVAHDITDVHRSMTMLELHQRVAVAANDSDDVISSLQEAVDAVCEAMDWPVGHAWTCDEESSQWVPTGVWRLADADRFAAFRQVTSQTRLAPGDGLPGRAAETARAAWIEDVTADPTFRRGDGYVLGIRAAMAFPVMSGQDVAAVLEFFSAQPEAPDHELLHVMGGIGRTLGRVIDRTRLVETEHRLRLVVETASDLISHHAPDGTYRYASPSCSRLLGYTPQELIGRRVTDLVHPDDVQLVRQQLSTAASDESGKTPTSTYRMRRKHGTYTWFETVSHTVRDPDSRHPVEVHSTSRDITARMEVERERESLLVELAQANARLERLAHFDELTGLANRNLLEPAMEQGFARARRAGTCAATFFIDLDGLKQVNDTFGHEAGDQLLVEVADGLRSVIRTGDTAARWGGDEFVVLAEGVDHPTDIEAIATRILDVARRSFQAADGEVRSSASIGVAVCTGDHEPPDVIRRADQMLYAAKSAGGDRFITTTCG